MDRYQAVSNALRLHLAASVRSEDIENYDRLIVDPIDMATVSANNNQLIFGRRGSGKTMLVGALTERINATSVQTGILAMRFTATDFYASPDVINGIASPRERTHLLFSAFIERLCSSIAELTERLMRRQRFLARLTVEGAALSHRRDLLEDRILELLEVASIGVEASTPSSIEKLTRSSRTSAVGSTSTRQIELKLQASRRPIAGGASLTAGGTRESSYQVADDFTKRPFRRYMPNRVKDLIGEIVDLLELKYLVIFIDEWMSLGESQVDFAERVRQSLFGDRRIAVKIAADQFQGQFNNSGQGHNFRGLDVGGDIFLGVDLDRPFLDLARQTHLFAEVLYSRLLFLEPELEEHFGKRPLQNPDRFIHTIFSTDRAFSELCHGSHGLVRDFHEILIVCAKGQGAQVSSTRKISTEAVRAAILKRNAPIYSRAVHSNTANDMLFKLIAPHVRISRSRYFIIESRPGAHTPIINDLLTKRIIHNVDPEIIHPSIRGEYDCYEVNFGIFLDLIHALEFSTGEDLDDSFDDEEVSMITWSSKENYLLEFSSDQIGMTGGISMLCPHCQVEFPSTAKAYVVRKICPSCYLDQE